jgi:hypothetical protein
MSPGIVVHVLPDWSLGWNLRTDGTIVLDRSGFGSFWFCFWVVLVSSQSDFEFFGFGFGFESFRFWIVLVFISC